MFLHFISKVISYFKKVKLQYIFLTSKCIYSTFSSFRNMASLSTSHTINNGCNRFPKFRNCTISTEQQNIDSICLTLCCTKNISSLKYYFRPLWGSVKCHSQQRLLRLGQDRSRFLTQVNMSLKFIKTVESMLEGSGKEPIIG